LIDAIKARIHSGLSVESSVVREFESQKQYLKKAKDALLRERAIDLDNIMYKLLSVLKKKTINYGFYKDSIVVANSVTPSDIVNFKLAGILGIITEVGGISSHSSILTRNYEIPEIIGLNNATQIITEDIFLIIDGYTGSLTLNPTEETVLQYKQKKNLQEEHRKKLGDLLKLPSETKDGKKINLLANLDFPEDVETAVMAGSEGIGLVRSENLLIKLGYFPGEDEQYEWYKSFAERSYPRPVTIRAYDVGSDKFAEAVPIHESNPALGYRGIRFLLKREDIFRTQVRAVLRASKTKNIHFMIPMLTSLGELLLSLKLINQCKIELSKEGIEFDDKMPVGVMIETPAAALISSKLAEYVQFFSIGTNDLTQYTLAADRTNELVVDYYNSFHPAVLRLIKLTTEGAAKSNISVSVCGEFAGHSAATSLLIGLGVTGLSASPSVLPELKNRIRTIDSRESIVLAEDILKLSSYSKIAKRLEKSS
jgi:phosphotransferase system enzyme I (PtsI)